MLNFIIGFIIGAGISGVSVYFGKKLYEKIKG